MGSSLDFGSELFTDGNSQSWWGDEPYPIGNSFDGLFHANLNAGSLQYWGADGQPMRPLFCLDVSAIANPIEITIGLPTLSVLLGPITATGTPIEITVGVPNPAVVFSSLICITDPILLKLSIPSPSGIIGPATCVADAIQLKLDCGRLAEGTGLTILPNACIGIVQGRRRETADQDRATLQAMGCRVVGEETLNNQYWFWVYFSQSILHALLDANFKFTLPGTYIKLRGSVTPDLASLKLAWKSGRPFRE